MRLAQIRIQNFRSFDDETINLDPYTCLVGPNGTGKSTILTALNVFFRNASSAASSVSNLCKEDFHHQDTSRPARITLTFNDLSQEAKEDFKHYCRQDKLVVFSQAKWADSEGGAEVKQHGSRLVMQEFAPFFKASKEEAKVAELRVAYQKIRERWGELPEVTTKPDMTDALRKYEESHPELCELIEETNLFYGWSKGENLLAKHIQWAYVPAVKDAASEQEEGSKTALGVLLQRTVRARVDFETALKALRTTVEKAYEKIVDENKTLLEDLQNSIQKRLKEWASPNARLELKWHYEDDKTYSISEPLARASIGDEAFIGEIARLGHGMQRAFLVSLLQELAMSESTQRPTLLLGFEEPELYQHPPQAHHLAGLLEQIATDQSRNTQVVLTTHCPYFVSGRGFENIRMARKDPARHCTVIASSTFNEVEARIAEALGEKPISPSSLMAQIQQVLEPSQRELFFTSVAVLVEGQEDVAYISTYLRLIQKWDEFRRLGCSFVVAAGKSNLIRVLAIAESLSIPTFVVFDSDAHSVDQRTLERRRKDNNCILLLSGLRDADPLPKQTLWHDRLVMWKSTISIEVSTDFGGDPVWGAAKEATKCAQGFEAVPSPKNTLLIAATVENLWNEGRRSPNMQRLCEAILGYAAKVRMAPVQGSPS